MEALMPRGQDVQDAYMDAGGWKCLEHIAQRPVKKNRLLFSKYIKP